MSKETIVTCDRCGYRTTNQSLCLPYKVSYDLSGGAGESHSYDLCETCRRFLYEILIDLKSTVQTGPGPNYRFITVPCSMEVKT